MKNNRWCLDQRLNKGSLLWEEEENKPQAACLPEPRMRDGCSLISSGSDLQHWHSRDKSSDPSCSVQASDSRDLNPSQEFPAAELDTSRARQVGRVGYPTAEICPGPKERGILSFWEIFTLPSPALCQAANPAQPGGAPRAEQRGMRCSRLYFQW